MLISLHYLSPVRQDRISFATVLSCSRTKLRNKRIEENGSQTGYIILLSRPPHDLSRRPIHSSHGTGEQFVSQRHTFNRIFIA